jgi:hypothetical protein
MVAEKRDGVGGPGQIDDLDAVGAAIDQIAQENETVILGQGEAVQEFRKFGMAAVNVSDGDEASVHFKSGARPGGSKKPEDIDHNEAGEEIRGDPSHPVENSLGWGRQ